MKYRIIPLFLLLSMLSGSACAEQLTCIVREGQYVNVRNQASSRAAAWGILHTGDVIDVNPAEIKNGFFKTTYKDHEAYVSVKYFETAAGEDYTVAANGRVRMRKSPAGNTSGFIQPGTRVHVIAWRYGEDGSKWARCTGGSYISAECLAPAE
ncbi:MAG: hypothetical protein IJD60_06340 [Clostridia bacterium]|nr:hypothetical protein [Clostridia bacterium]